jgi:hypothetical protein
LVTSPTIRVDDEDVALELRESPCGSELCTDGCGNGIACRVWVHRGREFTEPPVTMIAEAIVRHVYAAAPSPAASDPFRTSCRRTCRGSSRGGCERLLPADVFMRDWPLC